MESGGSENKLMALLHCFFQEQKDLQMKADMVTRLMERGYRVKVVSFPSFKDEILNIVFLIYFFVVDYVPISKCVNTFSSKKN